MIMKHVQDQNDLPGVNNLPQEGVQENLDPMGDGVEVVEDVEHEDVVSFAEYDNSETDTDDTDTDDTDEDDIDEDEMDDEDENELEHEDDHELVEHVADVEDVSKVMFIEHRQSVFCGDLTKNGKYAVTGGQDEIAYVWLVEDGKIHFECTGHKDSVSEVRFNHNDNFVATGDMKGLIQVWDLNSKSLIWCYEADEMEWLIWHDYSNVLFCGTQSGSIYLWHVPLGSCKILPSHGAPAVSAQLLPDGKKLLVGYADIKLKLWDIKSVSVDWQSGVVSDTPLTGVFMTKSANICAVAPYGNVYKIQDGSAIGSVMSTEGKSEIEHIVFNEQLNLVATGSLTGSISIWETVKFTLRHQQSVHAAITSMSWIRDDKLIATSCEGVIYVINGQTGVINETITAHEAAILSSSYSNVEGGDSTILLTTSDDGTAKIFEIK